MLDYVGLYSERFTWSEYDRLEGSLWSILISGSQDWEIGVPAWLSGQLPQFLIQKRLTSGISRKPPGLSGKTLGLSGKTSGRKELFEAHERRNSSSRTPADYNGETAQPILRCYIIIKGSGERIIRWILPDYEVHRYTDDQNENIKTSNMSKWSETKSTMWQI